MFRNSTYTAYVFKHNFCVKPYVPREARRDPTNRRLNKHGIYISDTARNRTHNLFRPKREPIPLGHSVLMFIRTSLINAFQVLSCSPHHQLPAIIKDYNLFPAINSPSSTPYHQFPTMISLPSILEHHSPTISFPSSAPTISSPWSASHHQLPIISPPSTTPHHQLPIISSSPSAPHNQLSTISSPSSALHHQLPVISSPPSAPHNQLPTISSP